VQYVKGRLCLLPLHARVLNSETGLSTLTKVGHPFGIEKIVRPSMRLQRPFFFQRKLIADTRDEVPSRDYPGVHALHPANTECPACTGTSLCITVSGIKNTRQVGAVDIPTGGTGAQ